MTAAAGPPPEDVRELSRRLAVSSNGGVELDRAGLAGEPRVLPLESTPLYEVAIDEPF